MGNAKRGIVETLNIVWMFLSCVVVLVGIVVLILKCCQQFGQNGCRCGCDDAFDADDFEDEDGAETVAENIKDADVAQ